MTYIFNGFGLRMLPRGFKGDLHIEEVDHDQFVESLDHDKLTEDVEAHAPTKDAAGTIEEVTGMKAEVGPAPTLAVDDVVYAIIPGPSFRFFILWVREND